MLLGLGLLVFGTGCQWLLTATQLASQPPRMTCPTPTPLPTIEVDDGEETVIVNGTPTTRTRTRLTEPYEREYGLPVVTPTAYIRESANFPIGTIVNLGGGVDAMLTVAGQSATRHQGEVLERLYRISVEWNNPGQPLTFDPYRQLAISQVQGADGRIRSNVWRWSPEAAAVSDLPAPSSALETTTQIPTGRSTMHVDLFAPDGQVQVAELRLDGPLSEGSGGVHEDMRVQFVAGPDDPNCSTNGLFGAAPDPARQAAQPVTVGGSADAIAQAALSQLGRQYCWGGKGFSPCSGCADGQCVTPACASYPCFDCSGLTWYAYQVNGISIGHGTSNQKLYQRVEAAEIQPGDLMLFTGGPVGSTGFTGIRHVGIYVGDADGDGTGDMVHAANYPDGVVLTKNVFANRYYQQRLAVITRPPR
ncbi:C40 family peptidase [Chloroflexus sp.]|uniref:C40 family peptidase n=1 Tax=Chloroflexus sp. TaxID=1904827 RepID=UPI002ACDE988|nr:NlpC/P60 family protein [Chloroflexus sp.]